MSKIFITMGIFLFLFSSCSLFKKSSKKVEKKVVVKKETKIPVFKIKPGEVRRLVFNSEDKSARKNHLFCKNKKIPTYYTNGTGVFFLAESYFSSKKPYDCTVNGKKIIKISVGSKKFPEEKLKVDKKKIVPPKKTWARIAAEQKMLNKVYASSGARPLFKKQFEIPLASKVTSIYGSKRLYNNMKQSQHLGTDYRAKVGVPIRSTNAGKVVVAQDLYFTGGTVVIDHGLGIFTVYGHLSKVIAAKGEYVPQNALVGLAGKTGRVTGPHLHWGVKVNGHYIEGDSLVKATIPIEH